MNATRPTAVGGTMFRDDRQLARACLAILATARIERLWTVEGPTLEASDLLEQNGGWLASDERVTLLAAWALWNGSGAVSLAEIVDCLDCGPAVALCLLVAAAKQGADAIDDWLLEHGAAERPG